MRLLVVSEGAVNSLAHRTRKGQHTVDRVEAFEEGLAVDEIKTLAGRAAQVGDDEVDGAGASADGGVQGALPSKQVVRWWTVWLRDVHTGQICALGVSE